MNIASYHLGLFVLCLWLGGCAVTEPTDLDRSRIASANEAEPTRPIESLSEELGISELAVVKALPGTMAREWQGGPESAWEAIQQWEVARFEVNTPLIQMRHTGSPREARLVSPELYMQLSSQFPVEIVADWADFEAVWLFRKSVGDVIEETVWFFDAEGTPILRVGVPDSAAGATQAHFEAMWDRAASGQ